MGGAEAGAVPRDQHDFALWEKRVDALMVLCSGKGLFTVDGLRACPRRHERRNIRDPSYYERWVASVNQNLVEAGAYTLEELGAKMDEVSRRGATYGEASGG